MKYINKLKDTIIGILILIMMIFVVAMAYKPFVDIGVNILTSNIDLPKSYEEGFDASNLSYDASRIVGAWYGEDVDSDTNKTMSGIFNFYSNGTGEITINILNGKSHHAPFTYTYNFKNNELEIVCKNEKLSFVINNIDDNSLTITDENSTTTYTKINYSHK
jgi:hypothetical protein